MSRWDVYRDKDGNAVTITPEQCAAIKHAVRVWADVNKVEREKNPKSGFLTGEKAKEISDAFNSVSVSKSCLLGRMLYQGRPPLDEAPPVEHAAPAYHLTDPELCPQCGLPRNQLLVTYCDGPHG